MREGQPLEKSVPGSGTPSAKALKAGGSTSKREELRGFDPWTGMIPHAASGDQLAGWGSRGGRQGQPPEVGGGGSPGSQTEPFLTSDHTWSK